MLRIVFAGPFAGRLAEPVRRHLAVPHEIVATDEAGVIPHLADADMLVSLAFTPAMAAAARRLKLVQVPGAGLDRIDRAALPKGVALANVYGHETGIAEYVIGAMLWLGRGVARLDAQLRQGVWQAPEAVGTPVPPPSPELAGKLLGILGYGHIGQALAPRARAFRMAVRAIRRDPARSGATEGVRVDGPEALDDLLRAADYLALTLPLSPATRGLLGARELGLMKRSAFLVNVGRGEVIDEAALYRALADGAIAGAALDVWYRYPSGPGPTRPAVHPFHELPNVLMTPHVSGWTEGMLAARSRLIAENAERLARGEAPLNLCGPG
jgi:phosphoglycerate dehydrogenase-like enzyme